VEYVIPKDMVYHPQCIQAPCTDEAIAALDIVETTTATLNSRDNNSNGYLGIATANTETLQATWSAPIVGVGVTAQLTGETFVGLGKLVGDFFGGLAKQLSFDATTRENGRQSIGEAGDSVAGPVGIIGVIFPQAAQSGIITVLFLAGIISLSLAVMNILPIPALDGGRWLLTVIFRLILKKPLTKEREEKIISTSFLILLALVAIITIVDITRLF
jgi:regulator of sigma E protease